MIEDNVDITIDEMSEDKVEAAVDQMTSELVEKHDDASVEQVGLYPEIAAKYKAGEELSDEELDKIVDVAIKVIREILGFFGADNCPIDEYDGDEGELILDVTAPDLAVLIGRHGRTLDSLQQIFSLLVSRKLGFRYPFIIDIEGYKGRRHDKIVEMARRAASRAVHQHGSVALQPMSAYERRQVHIALRDNPRVETHSEGVDPERRVVVTAL